MTCNVLFLFLLLHIPGVVLLSHLKSFFDLIDLVDVVGVLLGGLAACEVGSAVHSGE
jgi:hypothetical protein